MNREEILRSLLVAALLAAGMFAGYMLHVCPVCRYVTCTVL